MGYVLGCNVNKSNEKVGFAGAFVADPTLVSEKPRLKIDGRPTMLCDNLDDFDYKALYPSIIDESNMAPFTQHGKVFFPEILDPKENRFNNTNIFSCFFSRVSDAYISCRIFGYVS